MQNSNYAVIITEQPGFTYRYPPKSDCVLANNHDNSDYFLKVWYTDKCNFQ